MQTEDARVSDTAFAERRRETGANAPPIAAGGPCDTYDEVLARKKAYDAAFAEMERQLTALWGRAEAYTPCKEDEASLLQTFYYGWVQGTILLASKENLSREVLPPPTADVRTDESGRVLSRALQAALYKRNAWGALVGARVVSRLDAASSGVLRWVGAPQQGGYTRVMAAVEWDVAPAPRVAARSECAECSPFFNGTVHGERLFEPTRPDMCTLEEVGSIDFVLAPRTSELGRTIPEPHSVSTAKELLVSLPYYFWIQLPYAFVSEVCTLCTPSLLGAFISLLENKEATWLAGFTLVLGMFIVLTIQSVTSHYFFSLSIKNGLQYKGALSALIFEKCFTLSAKSMAAPTISSGYLLNLLGSDTERVNQFMQHVTFIWTSPFVLTVSIVLLGRLVGWSCVIALVALLMTLPISTLLTRVQIKERQALARATDERMGATNELLSGIRIAKFMTWEAFLVSRVESRRQRELMHLRRLQVARVTQSFVNIATPMVMIAAVFVVYFVVHRDVTGGVVFPTIALLGILRAPFYMIPYVINAAAEFIVAIARINAFLECDSASFSTVKSVEEYFTEGAGHSLSCQLAGVFEHTDITAFIPVRLPVAPKVRLTFVGRLLHRFGCEACAPPGRRPAPTAVVEDEEGGGGAVTPPAGSPASPAEPKKAPGQAQPKDEFFQLEPKVLLRDLSVQIPAGKLTLVLGATGCGKSTLLNALLGQFEVSRGHVWATKSIAYVPQQPWIMNATVRNNILFFDEEDAGRLDAAIRVSQLETDLGLFAAGLETEIGEKGINLSGGQKARVSLARAVYADRDMYLLDDPLSALDAHVGERIVDDCFLGQLAGKTRVLATHQLHVVPKADYVIVLEDHSVAYHGAAAEFMQSKMYHHMAASSAAEEEAAKKKNTEEEEEGTDDAKEVKAETIDDGGHGTLPKGADEEAEEAEAAAEGVDAGALMTKEEKAKGGVPLTTYLVYFRYCGGTAVAAIILGVFFCTEILTVSSSIWLSLWSTKHYEWTQKTYLTGYIILVLCGTVSAPSRYVVTYRAMRRGCVNLHKAILRSVSTATMEFFDRTPLGRIMNRFSRDIDLIDNGLQMSLISAMECFFSISSSMLITIISQPLVVIALVPCGYLYLRIMIFFNAANREIRRNTSVMKSPVYTLLGELLSGSSTISAYGRSSVVMKEALQRLDVVYSCGQLENTTNRWLAVRIELLSAVVVTSIAFVGVISVMFNFGDVGLISLSLTMAMQTTGQLNWLIRQTAAVEADMNSVERIEYYTEKIPHEEMPELSAEVDELEQRAGMDVSGEAADVVVEAPHPTTVSPHVVKAGSLEFRDVQMRYREGLPLVLRDVSFRIAPREKVGIVGRTGSGKSTLLLTFMRMVDICGGEIVVSGQPIRSYPLRELRKQFSMIPQDPVLFDGTVRLNVDPFLEASSAEVWDALELVGLRERIASEPEGIDGRVLEGGSNFSVGQRQLLCMARALLKKGSGFILMDEATANIDQSLDRHIQGTVMKAFSAYTVITIAHRLQTVAQYDKIIVMDHGVVAEMGSPRELVEWPDSVFRGMVDSMGKNARSQFMSLLENEGEVAHLRE